MKNLKDIPSQGQKYDVYSRFSDAGLEYVSLDEIANVPDLYESWIEFNNERKEYE